LLSCIPTANFFILHSIFSDTVKEAAEANTGKKDDNDLVCNSLISMKAEHPKFVSACMQVLHIPVANVDSERAFSAYGDIVSAQRCRLSATNAEVMMCLYFGDDLEEMHNNNSTSASNFNFSFNSNHDDEWAVDDPTTDMMVVD